MSTTDEARVLPEVVMNDELAKAIQGATTSEDVKALLIAESEKQLAAKTALDESQAAAAKAAADKVIADKAAADAAAVAAQVFTRDEVIGGRTFHFEASSDAEVDLQVLNAYKVAYAVRETETAAAAAPTVDPAEAARTAEAEVLAKAELERKFRLGEVTAADYIEQTGAMKAYLEKEGISVASLKETVEATQSRKMEKSWAAAGEEFKKTDAGADWPGGDKNQELIGLQIAALGLIDAEDKVGALTQAYAAMKRTGLYFPNGDAAPVTATATATTTAAAAQTVDAAAPTQATIDAARAAAASRVQASTSSSVFGASSGTSGAPITSPAVAAAKSIVPADATPQEIMAAYNAAQLAAGVNPDDALKQSTQVNKR